MNEAEPRILVVEDEPHLAEGIRDNLEEEGYAVELALDGIQGLEAVCGGGHDLVILDVMLPGLSGFEVCEQLRASGCQTPVLMLTARGAEEDVLRGFQCGADDYVVKPFSVAELTARVEALLRRSGALDRGNEERAETLDFGDWRIDVPSLCARHEDGERVIDLTFRDVEILALLSREAGRIVSRRVLLAEVWGYPDPDRVETRSVDMHIAKLRKKLGDGATSWIETVRGAGYRHPA